MSQGKKFGAFGGVFTPSILTILGVIMYMRLGMVVGNAGTLFTTIAIILLAHIVSVTTGLSVSSVATDKKIKAGGIYYMLSRSLGLPIGGAIGITLFVATALSIALYLIGFGESAMVVLSDYLSIEEITTNHLRIIGSIALLVIVTIAYISTSIAIKSQYFILFAIVLSLISIFLGTSEGKGFDTSHVEGSTVGFSTLFGIFFPAVTGFTAGVAMSGDLKDPKKAIPWGTMSAVVVGLLVYIVLSVFIHYSIPQAELINNNNALVQFGLVPGLVIVGIWGATLSSALGGILGAPRILQAMSIDKITPNIFGRGVGNDNEPRNALILTFIIAEAGILIGELNVIAEIVAMFYMAAYMFINLSCFLEQWASPDFRPKFKIYLFVPLIGTIATFLLMVQLNLAAALISVAIMALVFIWLTRRHLELGSGDVWQSVWSSVVKIGLKNLGKKSTHKRNWEPNILLFSGGTAARPHLLGFSKSIAGRKGMISNFDLIETPTAEVLFPKHAQAVNDDGYDDSIFHRKQECQNIFQGIEAIASTYGFSGVEPNTVMMGWARNTNHPIGFSQMTKKLGVLDYNVLYLDYDKEKGFGQYKRIDIWWKEINQESDLALQLVRMLLASPDWSNTHVRILYLNNDNGQKLIVEDAVRKRLEALRVDAEVEIVNNELEKKGFYEVVKINSFEADLILLNIPEIEEGKESTFIENTNAFLDVMGTTLLLKASSHFYDEEGFDPLLEMKYQGEEFASLFIEKTDAVVLGLPGYELLDKKIKIIDDEIHALNIAFVNRVYDTWFDVWNSYIGLFKERLQAEDSPSIEKALEIEQKLLEDIVDNRIGKITTAISLGIESHVEAVSKLVELSPTTIERIYTQEELKPNPKDSPKLVRLKKKYLRKKKQNIRFAKIVQHHFENSYLYQFKTKLNVLGLSSFIVNKTLKDWSIDNERADGLNDLKDLLSIQFKKEKGIFLQELNSLGRIFCNSITVDVDKLDVNNLSSNREEERTGKVIKNAFLSIASYPEHWNSNQKHFTNQLLVNVQLTQVRKTLIPFVNQSTKKIDKGLIHSSLNLFNRIEEQIDEISLEKLGVFEAKLLSVSNTINVDNLIKSITQKVDKSVNKYCDSSEVLSAKQINEFENDQYDLTPSKINVRKVVGHLIENELVSKIKEVFQLSHNAVNSEVVKVENALRLLKFTLQNKENESSNSNEIAEKVKESIAEAKEHLATVQIRLNGDIQTVLDLLKKMLKDEIIISRADTLDGIILREKTRKGAAKYLNNIKSRFEKINNGVDRLLIKARDLFAITGYQHRTKSVQNPHNRLADFMDSVSLAPAIEKQLPFYYKQLFLGKHIAPDKPLQNRLSELEMARKSIERFKAGRNGAILFTGDPFSGKSYLMHNVVNVYCEKKVYNIVAPMHTINFSEKLFDNSLNIATGIEGSYIQIMNELPEGSVLVFEDLELWWTRSTNGADLLNRIMSVVKSYGHKHLFLFDCNIYFYQHIRQYIDIDSKLLTTITVSPLTTNEINRAVMDRHSSGGVSFLWKGKLEKELKQREQNQLFKKLTSNSEGNVGLSFYMWLANISSIDGSLLDLKKMESLELPNVLLSDWNLMLLQILLHKQIDFNQLCTVYHTESSESINTTLQSLVRAGIVLNSNNLFEISPYALPYLIKYLRKIQLIN